jgi:hypothetical protein
MGMFVCEECGVEFRDDRRKDRRFCSERCSARYYTRKYRGVIKAAQPKEVPCHHNEAVFCTEPKRCGACGWNPDVAMARQDRILKRLGVVMP